MSFDLNKKKIKIMLIIKDNTNITGLINLSLKYSIISNKTTLSAKNMIPTAIAQIAENKTAPDAASFDILAFALSDGDNISTADSIAVFINSDTMTNAITRNKIAYSIFVSS